MAIPEFSMRQLLEAGVHFGHQAHRWNPKMADYIFGTRNNIHIIDLAQSVPMLHRALQAVSDSVARGGRVLFEGSRSLFFGAGVAGEGSLPLGTGRGGGGSTSPAWVSIAGRITSLSRSTRSTPGPIGSRISATRCTRFIAKSLLAARAMRLARSVKPRIFTPP